MADTTDHIAAGRPLTATLVALTVLALSAAPATAQDDSLTIAFYAPSVYFSDSVARAGFIGGVAEQVAADTGVGVEGVNLSSAGGLDEADFAIVDGIYFADSPRGEPVGAAEGDAGREAPLGLIVASSGPSRLAELAGATLILPRSGDKLVDFVTADILYGEIAAEDFFGAIEFTSNIESALSAVAGGQAEATVGFADYGERGGLRVLSSHGDAPLPVVVQLNGGLDADLARRVASAIRDASVAGEITGFTSYDGDAVRAFERRSTRGRTARTPLMTRPRSVTVDPGDVELPAVDEPLRPSRPIDLILLPDMEEP